MIQGAIALARGVVDALFELIAELSKIIDNMLSTPLDQMGIVGNLLELAGLGNIHIGATVNMLMAFPATLAFEVAHGGNTRPFGQLAALRAGAGAGIDDKTAKDLQETTGWVIGPGGQFIGGREGSRLWESNPRPTHYEAVPAGPGTRLCVAA